MSDLYSELLVKKERTAKDRLVKGSIIALIVLLVLAGLFIMPLLLIAAIVLGVCAYLFIFPGTDLEFEYLFVNGELDIDKIMAKSKRKRVKSLNITECDIMAPLNSHRMDYYNSNQKLKVQDFSSGNPEHKRFAIVCRDGADTCKVRSSRCEICSTSATSTSPLEIPGYTKSVCLKNSHIPWIKYISLLIIRIPK